MVRAKTGGCQVDLRHCSFTLFETVFRSTSYGDTTLNAVDLTLHQFLQGTSRDSSGLQSRKRRSTLRSCAP